MSVFVRRLVACLLIAFVPLQVTAASRLALCADMIAVPQESAVDSKPCAHMDAMTAEKTAPTLSSPNQHGNCWLGSICLAGLVLPPMPVVHTNFSIERNPPVYPAQIAIFHSIVLDSPLRPPATL
jgi:hypothetical protein